MVLLLLLLGLLDCLGPSAPTGSAGLHLMAVSASWAKR